MTGIIQTDYLTNADQEIFALWKTTKTRVAYAKSHISKLTLIYSFDSQKRNFNQESSGQH